MGQNSSADWVLLLLLFLLLLLLLTRMEAKGSRNNRMTSSDRNQLTFLFIYSDAVMRAIGSQYNSEGINLLRHFLRSSPSTAVAATDSSSPATAPPLLPSHPAPVKPLSSLPVDIQNLSDIYSELKKRFDQSTTSAHQLQQEQQQQQQQLQTKVVHHPPSPLPQISISSSESTMVVGQMKTTTSSSSFSRRQENYKTKNDKHLRQTTETQGANRRK